MKKEDLKEKYNSYYDELAKNEPEELRKEKSLLEVEVSRIKDNRTTYDSLYLPNFAVSLIVLVLTMFGVLVTKNQEEYTLSWYIFSVFVFMALLIGILIYNLFKEKGAKRNRLKEQEKIDDLELKIRVINDLLANYTYKKVNKEN